MVIVYDSYYDYYVWVDSHNHDIELSPHFDSRTEAEEWKVTVAAKLSFSSHVSISEQMTR